jgi:cell division protein FtsL
MRDWAGGIESRNYGIKRRTDRRNLTDLLRITLSVLMIGGVLLSYAWIRSQIVEMGYEEQSLQLQEKAILRVQNNLILEEETLKNPGRIDSIARNDLGMVLVRTNQLVAPQSRDSRAADSTTLAMVRPAQGPVESRKPSATN